MKRLKLLPLAAIALIGCLDGTGPRRPGRPNALISDGANGTTHRFFFFLPPIVPNPAPTGTFDRFRSPAVEICLLAGGENSSCITNIATFTMTSGPGSVIRVVPASQHYIVNWHTNLFPTLLPSPTIYRIQVFDQVSAPRNLLGFADVQLADNGREAKSLSSNQMIGLVDGRTLPIKFRIEFGAVDLCPDTDQPCARATVGPEGGPLIATDAGGVPLAFADFPAGWTDTPRDVEITQITGVFGPGEGPLEGGPEGVRQYPLFFEYSTSPAASPEAPFNLPVRIGVCNVGASFGDAFHPPHRGTTALALGEVEGTHPFVILDFAPTSDLLGGCVNAPPFPEGGGGEIGLNRLDGWQGLLARAGMLAANALAPRALEAAVLVDGGMGGSTEFFSPVGTVDTASLADFTVHDLSFSPAAPTTGTALTVSAVITNAGGATAAPATVNLCLVQFFDGGSGSTCFQPETPTLAAGESATMTETFNGQTAGTYHVYASVDTFEVVPESNETNNSALGPAFDITEPIVIDGTMSPGEWEGAATFAFDASLPEGGTVPATLFVRNDGVKLYLAVQFDRTVPDEGTQVIFEFARDADGPQQNGDDVFLYGTDGQFVDDFRTNIPPCTPPGSGEASCGFRDDAHGGTNDGNGAFVQAGTVLTFEVSHPLNSGDVGHDFALSAGDVIGMLLILHIQGTRSGGGVVFVDTYVPAAGFGFFNPITITGP